MTGPHRDHSRGLIMRFIQNPVAANLLMVVLLVGGALSASRLQSQVFPTISPGTVNVTVPFPGRRPPRSRRASRAASRRPCWESTA